MVFRPPVVLVVCCDVKTLLGGGCGIFNTHLNSSTSFSRQGRGGRARGAGMNADVWLRNRRALAKWTVAGRKWVLSVW
jgi:hypothetical protein